VNLKKKKKIVSKDFFFKLKNKKNPSISLIRVGESIKIQKLTKHMAIIANS